MRLFTYLLITLFLVVCSCTIEKRAFRKGYYISWNKSVPKERNESKEQIKTKDPEELTQATVSKDSLRVEETNGTKEDLVVENPEKSDTLQKNEQLLSEDPEVKTNITVYSEKALMERLTEAVEKSVQTNDDDPLTENEKPRKRLNLFALNAFVLAVAYVVLIFVALDAPTFILTPIVLAAVCLFAAIALAVIAIVKWKRNRGKFWGTFFALIALILLALGILLMLLAFLVAMGL